MRQTSADLQQFANRSAIFLAWCEKDHAGTGVNELVRDTLRQLADIYAAGFLIPKLDYGDAPEISVPIQEERALVEHNFSSLPISFYWTILDPTAMGAAPKSGCGDLFDDLLDIYADLKYGKIWYDMGEHNSAAAYWRQMFEAHWGRHAASAMNALQSWDEAKRAGRSL